MDKHILVVTVTAIVFLVISCGETPPGVTTTQSAIPSCPTPGLTVIDLNSPDLAVEDLVDIFLEPDSNAIISNIQYTGNNRQGGAFCGGTDLIGMETGIVLGTGRVRDAVGPNNSDNTNTAFGTAGDPDLDQLVPGSFTRDAAVLEFDFQCPTGTNTIVFEYVFGSEEYNELVNTQFNDVFSFFLNGQNVALLPNGVTPVAINTVNGGNPAECSNNIDDDSDGLIDNNDPDCTTPLDDIVGERNSNTEFYLNNDPSDPDGGTASPINIEADGLTIPIEGEPLINQGLNHLKIAIGDVRDSNRDSWVFAKTGSLRCIEPLEGRMTGGGSVGKGKGKEVRYGFTLHCNVTKGPNNLQVNWGPPNDLSNKFHMEELTFAFCSDDPDLDPNPPSVEFDTYRGIGTGRYNGMPGATAEWTFTDAGEPGRDDFVDIVIKDPSDNIVLEATAFISGGNHQAHPENQ